MLFSNYLISQSVIDVFTINISKKANDEINKNLKAYTRLTLDNYAKVLKGFNGKGISSFEMSLPLNKEETILLKLHQQNIYAEGFRVIEKGANSERLFNFKKPLHFIGTVVGKNPSLVSLTVTGNQLMGVISFNGFNYNLQAENLVFPGNQYLIYKESDLKNQPIFRCETNAQKQIDPEEELFSDKTIRKNLALSDVPIYLEVDYEMYKTNGQNTTATSNYVTSLFNVIKGIYASSPTNVSISISEIYVWTVPDTYDAANASGTSELLSEFSCERRNGYNGRIAHLLTTASVGGGIANLPSCPMVGLSSSPLYGVSGSLSNGFNSNLSVYSWDIAVITHELGHNFSSPHTHDCAWNGNNTPIDCCGNYAGYGSCACTVGVPIKGTIMSYCHITYTNNAPNGNPGIDLSQGFHPQVAARINNFAMNCLSVEEIINCPTPGHHEISVSNITGNSATLTCSISNNVSRYAFYYTDGNTGICYNNCAGLIANSINITGLSPSTLYFYEIVLRCSNSGWGNWSCTGNFKTLGDNTCQGVNTSINGNPVASDTYIYSNTINSMGKISGGSNVTFQAGNSIGLEPGFNTLLGSTFSAIIGNCPPN